MRKIITLLGIVLIASIFSGCKTTHQIQREVVRDTIAIYHHDTVRVERVKVLTKDSIVKDTIIIVKDTAGKVVYKEVIRDRYVRANKADTARFSTIVKDSAITKKDARREEVRQAKKESVISRALESIGLSVIFIAIIGLVYWLSKKKM